MSLLMPIYFEGGWLCIGLFFGVYGIAILVGNSDDFMHEVPLLRHFSKFIPLVSAYFTCVSAFSFFPILDESIIVRYMVLSTVLSLLGEIARWLFTNRTYTKSII